MNLEPGSIAELWDNTRNPLGGCTGVVLETYRGGPPRWTWRDGVSPPRISGMSYDRCPVKPIVTGTGPVITALCNTLRYGISFPRKWRRRRGAANGLSAGPGTGIKAQAPKWAYPDIIVIGKTNFTDERRGDLIYRDEAGNMLNLTRLQSSK